VKACAATLALVAVVALAGCALVPFKTLDRHHVADAQRAKAEALEREGALRAALDATGVALALDPDDARARALKSRLLARIAREVAERLGQARAAVARRADLEARRHFLAVLALDPGNAAAFDGLRNQVQEVRFITHTIRAGDTLGSIAQRYYGDRSRSEVIWEVNRLPRNPKLVAGVSLRVPEIPGVPFVPPPRESGPATDDVAPEVDPLLQEAKEALERQEFSDALSEVDALLEGNPGNTEGAELKKSILYALGKTRLAEKKYDESYKALTQLARLAPSYEDAAELTREARAGVVQARYNEGLRLYRDEKLEQAIMQWRSVLDLDPRHPSARKNIEQAEQILKKLEERTRR
jgi:tetratricopeptide (TPR) repeat protein